MTENEQRLARLFEKGEIRIARGSIFDRPAEPRLRVTEFERVEGMLLGLAFGDALGLTTEGLLPDERRRRYGEVRDYLPNPLAKGRRVGTPTDDTQLAFWALELALERGRIDPAELGRIYTERQIYGLGMSVGRCLRNLRRGVPWYQAGPESAGNGSLMRIAPILVPHLRTGGTALWADVALTAMLTHNDSAAIASCVAFVSLLWDLLGKESSPAPGGWLQTYLDIATELETNFTYRPRLPHAPEHQGRICDYAGRVVPLALERGMSTQEACDWWGSGAYLLETIPSVFFILAHHGGDPEEAVVRAVNDTRDNDTVGAIVGAAVGALHGAQAFPERWRRGLLGRTRAEDDGRIFELIDAARKRFWED